jgi:hypothetical protein
MLMIVIFASLSLPVLAALKTDVIIFKNGDRLTGEIKSLIEQNQSLAHRVNELEKQNQHIEGLVMLMVSELAVQIAEN